MLTILKFPNPILTTPCRPVEIFEPIVQAALGQMWETMKLHDGIGLAANQVGINARMFVMEGPGARRIYLVNPKIAKDGGVVGLKEGCLSAPGEFLILPRRQWVEVEYQDHLGNPHREVFEDLYAVCVQHEIEHLDGKSYLLSPALHRAKRRMIASKWGMSRE